MRQFTVDHLLFIYLGDKGFSYVWNKKESRFKKDFGHSQNLSYIEIPRICIYNKTNLTKRQKKVPKQFQIVVGILGTPVGSQLR